MTAFRVLAAAVLAGAALAAAPRASGAQGRCIRAYGTPACNTDPIPPVFAKTGWRTTGLDHIAFRVADPKKEAAFYVALMGWKVRSDDGTRVVMDMGDWGTAVFRQVSADSFPPPRAGARANAVPVRAVVEGFGFDIEPWNAKTVEAELKKRGLNPVAENGPNGFESFHVKDPDGFDRADRQRQALQQSAGGVAGERNVHAPAPFESTGWQTVWLDHLSYGAVNYKASVSFYVNLLGWGPTYDEGSQNELMIGDVGDIIIRGGNPLDPSLWTGERPSRWSHRSHLVRHLTVGHGQGEGRAGEARAALVDRHVRRRRDSRRAIQELSHDDAERIQPADQLQHARHTAQSRDRRQSASRREVVRERQFSRCCSLYRFPSSAVLFPRSAFLVDVTPTTT